MQGSGRPSKLLNKGQGQQSMGMDAEGTGEAVGRKICLWGKNSLFSLDLGLNFQFY